MSVGPFQVLIIALMVLLLFGRGRISETLGDLGRGVKAFRRGMADPETQAAPLVIEGPHADMRVDSAATQSAADK